MLRIQQVISLPGHSGQEPASYSDCKWVSRSAKGWPIKGTGKKCCRQPDGTRPACILHEALTSSTDFSQDNAPWPLTGAAVVSDRWREPVTDRDCACLLRNPGFRLAGLEENPWLLADGFSRRLNLPYRAVRVLGCDPAPLSKILDCDCAFAIRNCQPETRLASR